MNKNLKKVISAVAVLAMSASSFVAFAANYPDVDASASYKQAVDELSALEVINGYEDGTFRPDDLVTRAEFSKMVITALGSAELAQAEAAAGRDTQFTDVTGSHWAAGFVTAAVSQSIINGMGDGTFAPDANVTYAQAMKMLVCAAGYEQWSMDQGGWPDGYMYWGNQLKVGNGVKDVTDSTEITRAQVAQMIDNIIDAPVCVDTHKYNFDRYGNQYAELEQMNGTGRDFESILTRNHDTYKVRGTVTATSRSGSEVSNIDEIKFEIQNAKKWLDETQAITRKDSVEITANVGDTNVADYLKQYVEVMIREDDDDEYTILSVATAGQTDENVEAADDYDAARSTDERIYFYTNGKQKSYKINDDTELYVNGVSVGSGDDFAAGIATYVEGNTASDVTLIDVPDSGASTDGIIDLVYVNYYATAIVDSVSKVDTDNPEISFMDYTSNATSNIEFDLTARDMSYTIVDTEGNAVELADLAEYDVLSIKYDVTADTTTARSAFKNSSFYDIIVSKKTEEGKVSTYNSEDEEYDINGTTYSIVTIGDNAMVSGLDMSVTYTLYLDAFGRIAYVDETAVDKKIAILDAVYTVRGSETEVSLVLKDGSSEAYLLRDIAGNDTLAKKTVYKDGTGDDKTKNEVYERVIEYTLNSSNELTIKKVLTGTQTTGLFRASVDRLGTVLVSEDTTSLLNVSEVVNGKKGDIATMSYSALVDERDYEGYAFDRANDGTYRFVLVTNGSGSYSPDTQLAVYKGIRSTQNDNGDAVTALVMLVDGAEKQVTVADNYAVSGLVAGEPVVYSTNSLGEIDNITKVMASAFSATPGSTYNALREAALGTSGDTSAILASGLDTLLSTSSSSSNKVEFAFGPIIGKTATSVTLAAAKNGQSTVTGEEVYVYDSNVKIYVYDSEETKPANAVAVGAAGDVVAQKVSNQMYQAAVGAGEENTKSKYNWQYGEENTEVNPSFAIVRTVDNIVKEVYVITANDLD